MKKQLIIYLLSFIIMQAFPASAVKKIEANPINIAVILTQETDTTKIASTLDYYGYTRQHGKQAFQLEVTKSDDSYTVFTHPSGSIIRYYLNNGDKYPTIEVKSKASTKEKDKILKNLNFHKQANKYKRKSIGFVTYCTFEPHGSLVFERHSNQHK